ncbi:MAG: hypothetical protein KGJ75_16340 [Alphaproteobacteria bacterium]|nr:hypothetical protein [Alphaproteobacteria bacterium]
MHFFAFVLFSPDEWPVYEHAVVPAMRERIRRFNIHLEVPEYRPPCRCLGQNADRARPIAYACRNAQALPPEFWTQLGLGLKPPSPHCPRCGGSGRDREGSTFNPEGHFDYYRCWSFGAWLADRDEFDEEADCFGPVARLLAGDDNTLRSWLPHVIVTPDLCWHEQDGDAATWHAQARACLEANREAMAVIVNLHG